MFGKESQDFVPHQTISSQVTIVRVLGIGGWCLVGLMLTGSLGASHKELLVATLKPQEVIQQTFMVTWWWFKH